jgi:hypothetical protein
MMLGGCFFSDTYHLQVMAGYTTPKPYPIIRFWAEYSAEEFHDNVLACPLVGIPGIVPIGYTVDLCLDTLFLPVDLLWGCWTPEVEIQRIEREDGACVAVKTATASMSHDDRLLPACIPVKIDVQRGRLTVLIKHADRVVQTFNISPEEAAFTYWDYFRDEFRREKRALDGEDLVLYCCPIERRVDPLLMTLLRSVKFTNEWKGSTLVSLRDEATDKRIFWARRIGQEFAYDVAFVPSVDFEGSITYQGQEIRAVSFSWH